MFCFAALISVFLLTVTITKIIWKLWYYSFS